MADASPHDSHEAIHYNLPEQRVKRRTMSFGLAAISVILVAVSAGLAFKLTKQNALLADTRAQLDRANSDNAAAKAELATTGTRSTGLQAQLDKAKQDQTALQAQVKKATDASAGVQADFDKTQADLKSLQEKSQADLTGAQAQLKEATDASAGLRKDLDAAKAQITDLNVQIAKAKEAPATSQPVAAPTRTLPLTTDFKKSFFGGTYTLKITNPGADALNLNITVAGATDTTPRSTTIAPKGTFDVKDLGAGAQVTIASEGYSPMNVTVK